ncbi:MAG: EAL domain-containing protein [Rhizobiaceae bacterium]|nr:EAL domain-containing protein [Rhizobiaceae bacterium]
MFVRRGLFVSILALAAVALYSISVRAQTAQDPIPGNALAIAAVVVALISVGVAIFAVRRAEAVRSDFRRFSRSVEMALDDVSSRSTRDSATIGELNRMVADEIRGMADLRAHAAEAPQQQATPRPRPRAVEPEALQPASAPPIATQAFEDALAAAVADNTLQISLQPIISVSQSTAAGFEVHAHVPGEDANRPVDIRRLTRPVAGLDPAAFEQALLRRAIETGRRQLGSDSERMPFHIPVSEALLANEQELGNLAELTSQHRALAKSVVFSIAADSLELHGAARDNLDRLTGEGFRLALEDWDGDAEAAIQAAARGVVMAKVAADRLLDRPKPRRGGLTGADMVEALREAGIRIVATGVTRDEDAVNLIDLGIDLMEGDRFSGPKLIKAPASRRAALAET